ncbi:hypothetical protein FRC02_002763 [Tulasnella sp. 418]|nr:hypothetical protein FRC02_002763 [Tulasnella sp. 418]
MWGFLTPLWQGYDPATISSWGQVAWKWSSSEGVAGVSGGWLSLIVVSVVTGLISGLTEALDLGDVDDNLSLPIISGTLLFGLSKLANWFIGSA